MEAWNGGAPRVVADYTEAFGLQNLQTVVIGGRCVAPDTNKLLLLHLVGCLYYCIRDARSHKHQV